VGSAHSRLMLYHCGKDYCTTIYNLQLILRKVWWHQRGNQEPQIEDRQRNTQLKKDKKTVRSFVPLLWYINGIFRNLTWRVSLVEKELIKLDAFTCLVQSCCVCYAFHIEMLFVSSQVPFVLKRVYVSFMLFVFIHTYCCPIWFPYQMMSLYLEYDKGNISIVICDTGFIVVNQGVMSTVYETFEIMT
jgi:hypothetical protein